MRAKNKKDKKEKKAHPYFKETLSFGQIAADKLTGFAGSWKFITSLFIFLILWMAINTYFLISYELGNPFDPYPFILLNLILSCLAAVQAPIILMSQNRQAERDRITAKYDYQVTRKAEREILQVQKQLNSLKRMLDKIVSK
jgi:uncharacterized membrane protein